MKEVLAIVPYFVRSRGSPYSPFTLFRSIERERERMVREVAESCVESLLTEIVSQYCNGIYANKPDLAARRIEAIGYQVGHQLSERYTMERPRFSDHLEAIKFICKDFWSELFKKQIDNLKTNHKGTFVLQDNKFRWLSRVSIAPSSANSGSIQDPSAMAESKEAQATGMYLYFPCGIIRGALSNLGIPCAVSADISNLPASMMITKKQPIHDPTGLSLSPPSN
ncbi:hypothetical protein RHSIM_Rhsim05G0148100 [Rhododendron simsii]|uniref:Trafficking protein particle complex subunit 6B n=1 Tax=Rhododendron simsii TaxID=118357 RepID=A0A834GWA7_RHOSS|nr:hypothetical protein RHSIM_Rhsim05G0148100 [Rhododendron simsii]